MNQSNASFAKLVILSWLVVTLSLACSPQQTPLPRSGTATITPQPTKPASPTAAPQPTSTHTPPPTSTPTQPSIPTPVSGQAAADQLYKKGEAASQNGDHQQALEAFNQAIAAYPWAVEPYYGLKAARQFRDLFQTLDQLDEEIAQLDEAITQDVKDPEPYYRRGFAKLMRILFSGEPKEEEKIEMEGVTVIGDPMVTVHLDLEGAILDFDQAIRINPKYAEAYHLRGLANHLESLVYLGNTLTRINQDGIRKAMQDYARAIQYDPELASVHNDYGAAYAHLAEQGDNNQNDKLKNLEQAIAEYTRAIELDPSSTAVYLNRAYAIMNLTFIEEFKYKPDQEEEATLKVGIEDSTRVIEDEPWNPWGYVLRSLIGEPLVEMVGPDALTSLGTTTEEDYEKSQQVGGFIFYQDEITDWITRLTTLSIGPPVFPDRASVVGLKYERPDLGFNLEIPKLMSPNAAMLAEQSESGDFLLRFTDDVSRWYSLQVHPGLLGDQALEEWVQDNLLDSAEITKVSKRKDQDGDVVSYLYRIEKWKADCASAVQYSNQRFYTATYCLGDETDTSSMFRVFAGMYEIEYEPVGNLLDQFLKGLAIQVE